jgi:hypothetical protein
MGLFIWQCLGGRIGLGDRFMSPRPRPDRICDLNQLTDQSDGRRVEASIILIFHQKFKQAVSENGCLSMVMKML